MFMLVNGDIPLRSYNNLYLATVVTTNVCVSKLPATTVDLQCSNGVLGRREDCAYADNTDRCSFDVNNIGRYLLLGRASGINSCRRRGLLGEIRFGVLCSRCVVQNCSVNKTYYIPAPQFDDWISRNDLNDIRGIGLYLKQPEESEEAFLLSPKQVPSLSEGLYHHMKKLYHLEKIHQYLKKLYRSWYLSCDLEKHKDKDWIRRSLDILLLCYEDDDFKITHSEYWCQARVWIIIDRVFELIQDCKSIRGENSSAVSSYRKNSDRVVPSVDKLSNKEYGHRGDLIIRKGDVEYTCGEDKSIDDSTNILEERGMKCPKMMKDVLWSLFEKVKYDESSMQKSCFIGITTFGLDIYMDLLHVPKGYTALLSRDN